MKKLNKKVLNVLTSAAILSAVAAPFASAHEGFTFEDRTHVNKVPTVSGFNNATRPVLTVEGVTRGEAFRVVLPAGTKWDRNAAANTYEVLAPGAVTNASAVRVLDDQTLEVVPANGVGRGIDAVNISLLVDLGGATGETVKVYVDAYDSRSVKSGEVVIATKGGNGTTTTVVSPKNFGDYGVGGTIRIEENKVGAIDAEVQRNGSVQDEWVTVTAKLPAGFEWVIPNNRLASAIQLAGDFADAQSTVTVVNAADTGNGTRTLVFKFNPRENRNQRGSILITPYVQTAIGTSVKGDVTVAISGTHGISDAQVTIGKHADYGYTVSADVKTLLSGKFDNPNSIRDGITVANEFYYTGEIKLKEMIPGSLYQTIVNQKYFDVTLPSWVKVTAVDDIGQELLGSDRGSFQIVNATSNTYRIFFNQQSNPLNVDLSELKFKLGLSIEGNRTGDIEAEFKLRGGADQYSTVKAVIAKAAAPVSVKTSAPGFASSGQQGFNAPDIIITEAQKGAIEKNYEARGEFNWASPQSSNANLFFPGKDGKIELVLPSGVEWKTIPTVDVLTNVGGIELGDAYLDRKEGNLHALVIPVKSESTVASEIKISNVQLDVTRSNVSGPITVKVGGSAVVENYFNIDANNRVDAGESVTDYAATTDVASNVTPPASNRVTRSVFTIGNTTYTVNGVNATLEAAPYISNARTMLPVRAVAESVGATVAWDAATKTVTLVKGGTVAKIQVGNKNITVNGNTYNLGVAPEIKNGRVFLPVFLLQTALGTDIEWDATAKAATVIND